MPCGRVRGNAREDTTGAFGSRKGRPLRCWSLLLVVIMGGVLSGCATPERRVASAIEEKRWNQAQTVILRQEARSQDEPEALLALSRQAQLIPGEEMHEVAIRTFERARELGATPDPERLIAIAIAYHRVGRHQDAVRLRKEFDENAPADPELRLLAITARKLSGQLGPAQNDASQAIREFPDFAPLHHYRGWLLYLQGNKFGAEQDFLEAVRLQPDLVQAWYWLAKIAYINRRPDLAMDRIREGLSPEPTEERRLSEVLAFEMEIPSAKARLHHIAGMIHHDRQNLSEATASLRRAIELDEQFGPAWRTLAVVSITTRQTQEVVAALEKAVVHDAVDIHELRTDSLFQELKNVPGFSKVLKLANAKEAEALGLP